MKTRTLALSLAVLCYATQPLAQTAAKKPAPAKTAPSAPAKPAAPAEVVVSSAAELEAAVANAKPGAVLVLADGEYRNFVATLNGRGTQTDPITIRAQTPGKVKLAGEVSVTLDGEWLVFSGFIFTDGNPKSPATAKEASSASALYVRGKHNRVTEISMIDFSKNFQSPADVKADEQGYHKWIGLWGQYHRVDHSLFRGKKGGGTLFVIWRDNADPNYHQVDHNTFLDVAYGNEKNGWETIRVGTSTHSQSASNSVFEYNYFEGCNGEGEIISNKSGNNIYRFNTIKNSQGALTLRHGSGVTVENNAIFQGGNNYTGGIRVTDKNHIIRNNYIEGVRSPNDSTAAIALLAHSENPPLNDYWPIENLLVENNTIVNSSPALLTGGSRAPFYPLSAAFKNNVFCNDLSGDSGLSLFKTTNKKGSFTPTFEGNIFCAKDMGKPPADLGSTETSAASMKLVDGLWLSSTPGKGYQPVKITKREDTGPQTYKP